MDKKDIMEYLDGAKVEILTEERKIIMEEEIQKEELRRAIFKRKENKSPGPDGFSAIYYKAFVDLLEPLLLRVFNQGLESGKFPQSWDLAYIVLLPKYEKEILKVGDYRPISLLNMDY